MASNGNPTPGWVDWLRNLPDEVEQMAGKIPGSKFALNVAQKFGGGSQIPQQDTTWHDQMLQTANDSFRTAAEKERQQQAVRQSFKDAAARRQSGASE